MGPIMEYHVPDIPNAETLFACPLVEFALFKVKYAMIYEYYQQYKNMERITKELPAFIEGAKVYKLEDPWVHGLIAGWKYQEVSPIAEEEDYRSFLSGGWF